MTVENEGFAAALYQQSLTQEREVAAARIQVEFIRGPILLLSGEEDTMWPGSDLAEDIFYSLAERNLLHADFYLRKRMGRETIPKRPAACVDG